MHCCSADYFVEGFLTMQMVISFLVMNQKTLKNVCSKRPLDMMKIWDIYNVDIVMKQFPIGTWVEDEIETIIDFLAGVIVLISFAYFSLTITRSITLEKEQQLKVFILFTHPFLYCYKIFVN